MKKGFTLVELLVVVVVLITLMAITFRLNKFGTTAGARATTVEKMARLENALSGYYAAFGTYPPVKEHQRANIRLQTDAYGRQLLDKGEQEPDWANEWSEKRQVRAACQAQPVGCSFPYQSDFAELVLIRSDAMKKLASTSTKMDSAAKAIFSAGFDDGVTDNIGRHSSTETDWNELHLFKFGLMSYLLPRYLVMMHMDSRFLEYAQWKANNEMPCNPMTGEPFVSWEEMQDYVKKDTSTSLAYINNIPSQAACARWIANFENQLTSGGSGCTLFGVTVAEVDPDDIFDVGEGADVSEIYSPSAPGSNSTSGQYILDKVTIKDGWGNEFYYHSPAPYQGYILWSSGPDGRTFPPFVARDQLTEEGKKYAAEWTADDVISLRN